MNITDYLTERSNGLIKRVKEYRDEGLGYEAFNDGSIECEVGDFLYGMVRILKPRGILETGTYKGISSSYMAQGLKDNKTGLLETLEIAEEHIQTSKQLWSILDLLPWIQSNRIESLKYEPTHGYEMMFLDSEMNLRLHELVRFYQNLLPGGYVFIHDMPITLCQGNINPDHPDFKHWPVGECPSELKELVKTGKLRFMTFPNPRGMIGFYRPKEGEYNWL